MSDADSVNLVDTVEERNNEKQMEAIDPIDPIDPTDPIDPIQAQGPRIKWGSKVQALAFNPFKRTRNLPFSMGRRRSIHVFPTIQEHTGDHGQRVQHE